MDAPIHGGVRVDVSGPSMLQMDNQSAIAMSKNPEHQGKMNHLSLRLFWISNAVQKGLIGPVLVSTQNMAADIFTECIGPSKFRNAQTYRNAWFCCNASKRAFESQRTKGTAVEEIRLY
jgi:hypothetical protein